jgi:Nif-specific regulatory protein
MSTPPGMPVVVPDVAQAPEFIDRTGAFGPQAGHMLAFVCRAAEDRQGRAGRAGRAARGAGRRVRLSDDQRILTMVASLLAQAAQLRAAVRDEHQRLQQETTRLQKALQREPRGATRWTT